MKLLLGKPEVLEGYTFRGTEPGGGYFHGLPFADNSIDEVLLKPASLSKGEIEQVLKEASRVLRGGGVLNIVFPNFFAPGQQIMLGREYFEALLLGEASNFRRETESFSASEVILSFLNTRVYPLFNPRSVKVTLGPPSNKEGFISISDSPSATYIRPLNMYLPFNSDSVDELEMSSPHLLSPETVDFIISEAFRVLKHKGIFRIGYPIGEAGTRFQRTFYQRGAFSDIHTKSDPSAFPHWELLETERTLPGYLYGQERLALVLLRG